MDELIDRHWHHLPDTEVLDLLDSNQERGLDRFSIEERQRTFGMNRISARRGQGPLIRFLLQFHQPLIYILIGSGVITGLFGEWVDTGVIFGVVLFNAIIGYVQEAKAVDALAALSRIMTSEATVLRQGEKRRIPAEEVVPGDIVLLLSGDKVPADLRLLSVRDLRVDESSLTGESLPSEKSDRLLGHDTMLADRVNMAYASTLVTYGQATGVVVATGDRTEVGRISQLIADANVLDTPLTQKISHFSDVLLKVILGLTVLTVAVGMLRGEPLIDMLMAAVALAVGAIPEGLPAAVTVTLAIGVSRMAKRRAIVRRLPAVETLGSTTVICSDKTGTLTENQMTVQTVWAGGEEYAVSGSGYDPAVGGLARTGATLADDALPPAITACLTAGALCNDSRLVEAEGQWRVQGDPTEGALLTAAARAGLKRAALKKQLPRLDSLPFESEHQYMATLHDAGVERLVLLKGSTEAVLARCVDQLGPEGGRQPIDHGAILARVEAMAGNGLRVLAVARLTLGTEVARLEHGLVVEGLTFLGLQGMMDPPRQEAMQAVAACQAAGVRVKMITGDHVATAVAIASRIGLVGTMAGSDVKALTGQELAKMSDTELIERVEETTVFARVSPEQKLRLVEALQARGQVVAMTGDGVNDAPALKQADIGIAMGRSGTEVAREAAAMVLTDDNFSSIEAAVEEGRGVFDNLIKFIVWSLPTNLGEGLVIMAAIFAGVALPMLPVQILWINMTTAGILGLALAFEPKEEGIMARPPRDPRTPILTSEMVFRIVLVSVLLTVAAFGLFQWELGHGSGLAEARTATVNAFVVMELFYLFNCRSLRRSVFSLGFFSNPWVFGGASAMLLLQIAYTYLPVMNRLFVSAPISASSWLLVAVSGLATWVVVEVEKWLRHRRD